jgi:hypothetical protein
MNRAIFVFVFALAVTGCAPTVKYVPTSQPFCAAVQAVCISKDDKMTEGTATQIEANNLGHARVCKKRVACNKQGKPL